MKRTLISSIYLFYIFITPLMAQTTWRGPGQSGVYDEQDLLSVWPTDGPEITWHNDDLGEGYSSPAFANDRIYVSGMEGNMGYVYALTENGNLMWKVPYGKEFEVSYPGSRSSPVIDGRHLYILSAMGDLACINALTGQPIWSKNLVDSFGARIIQWGLNETMVIHGDKLICTPGGSNHNMIALDRHTGDLLWSSKAVREKSAYCTPLLVELPNRNLLVTHTENNIIGVDADNGNFLWSYPHPNRYAVHPNTPLFYNNQVFCFSGYGMGGVMLQLNDDGSKVTKRWFSESMDSRIGGAVVIDGKIYGSGDESRAWQCINWETGDVEYKLTSIGNGVVIAANGLLYWYSQRGELALVKPGDSDFEIISETRVSLGSGQHWAHPVINKGSLYIRHGNSLVAYKISN